MLEEEKDDLENKPNRIHVKTTTKQLLECKLKKTVQKFSAGSTELAVKSAKLYTHNIMNV